MSLELKDGTNLTQRQVELVLMINRGLSNLEIAQTMGVSEMTVKVHVARLFKKLNAKNRSHAVYLAAERGLVIPSRFAVSNSRELEDQLDKAVELIGDLTSLCKSAVGSGALIGEAILNKVNECENYLKTPLKKPVKKRRASRDLALA